MLYLDRYNTCGSPQEYTNEEIDRELYEGETALPATSSFDWRSRQLRKLPCPATGQHRGNNLIDISFLVVHSSCEDMHKALGSLQQAARANSDRGPSSATSIWQ